VVPAAILDSVTPGFHETEGSLAMSVCSFLMTDAAGTVVAPEGR